MPSDDLIINVRQITNYPFKSQAGFGDAVLLQAGLNGPYYQMSAQGLVASALQVDSDRGLGVGASLPFGAGGNILAGNGFVAPLETGLLFNCFVSVAMTINLAQPFQSGLNYFAPGPAGALVFNDAGFCFLGFPSGNSLDPVVAMDAAATLSRTGTLAVREQVTVGRDPIGPNEVVSFAYFTQHAITRNAGNGQLNLQTADIVNAGGATAVNATLAGYPKAEHPGPEADDHEIATAAWVRQTIAAAGRQRIAVTLPEIVFVGGAPLLNPQFEGQPRAPTQPTGDSSTLIATTAFVTQAITAALAAKGG